MHPLFQISTILSHGDVQEVAVVRDQDEGIRISAQVLFEPVARFQVEVVGGLVEQQQVRLFEQQFGQRDAHLPAAGELFRVPRPIVLAEAEAGEHRSDLRLDRIAVARAELAVQPVEAVGDLRVLLAGGIQFRHAMRQGFLFLLDRADVRETRSCTRRTRCGPIATGHPAAGSRRDAFRDGHATVVERFHAAESL